jgi:hypothetical protein
MLPWHDAWLILIHFWQLAEKVLLTLLVCIEPLSRQCSFSTVIQLTTRTAVIQQTLRLRCSGSKKKNKRQSM